MEAINNAGSAVGILAKDGIVIAGTSARELVACVPGAAPACIRTD